MIHRRPAYVRELIRDGRIVGYRLANGGPWLIERDSVSRLLTAQPAARRDLESEDRAVLRRMGWE